MSEIRDCHYCVYASCNDADSDVDCYVEDGNYFHHHVREGKEAEQCDDFEYCDVFPKT